MSRQASRLPLLRCEVASTHLHHGNPPLRQLRSAPGRRCALLRQQLRFGCDAVHSASSIQPSKFRANLTTALGAVPALSLAQAGCMCVCRSAAWDAKTVTSAWWVHADQVCPCCIHARLARPLSTLGTMPLPCIVLCKGTFLLHEGCPPFPGHWFPNSWSVTRKVPCCSPCQDDHSAQPARQVHAVIIQYWQGLRGPWVSCDAAHTSACAGCRWGGHAIFWCWEPMQASKQAQRPASLQALPNLLLLRCDS